MGMSVAELYLGIGTNLSRKGGSNTRYTQTHRHIQSRTNTHINSQRQTDTHPDRQTHIHIQSPTNTHTNSQTATQTHKHSDTDTETHKHADIGLFFLLLRFILCNKCQFGAVMKCSFFVQASG